jgi:predicted ATPase/DNA-binding SARP family transcriptional activator
VEGGLPGRLGRALLAYLVLHRHRQVTRDELVHALWPSRAPRDPGATLSTLLSSLRRALGPELLQGRGELRLELPPDAEVDVEVAAAALAGARASAGGDPERTCSLAQAALDVYESALVPSFDAPWIEEHRRLQEEARLEALELLGGACLALGDEGASRAQLAARQLVELAPFRESGHALLMRAHAARGNHAEALQAYDRLRCLLRDELGSTPSAELRALHEELVRATDAPAVPSAADAPVPLPPVLTRTEDRPFVGREDALTVLRSALAELAPGRRAHVLVGGEPGIGKTALTAAFAREARDSGALVLYGRCDEQSAVPYQPFVEMVSHLVLTGHLAGAGDDIGVELDELGRLVPELRRRLPPSRLPPGGLPDTDRYRLFEAMATTLSRVAGERPLVLLVDDLHWADQPTLLLLRHLVRADEPGRLLWVGAYRNVDRDSGSPFEDALEESRDSLPLLFVELQGFEEDETSALIGAHREEAPARELVARLQAITGGNPFFLEQALRAINDPAGVPAGVREVVLGRIAKLGPPASEVLGVAAVLGASFRADAIAPAAGLDRDEVAEALDRAVSSRLLTEAGTGRLAFSHSLIQRAIYDELGGVVRAHLHERVARTLEERRAELRPQPAELAHHFYEARESLDPEQGVRYARDAADHAAASLAWEDAVVHLERALELDGMRTNGDPADRCELLLRIGEMRMRAGHPEFSAALAGAAELARGRSSTQLARAAIGYAGLYYEAGVVDEQLVELLREALVGLDAEEQELRARVLARLAEILHFAGAETASRDHAAEAVRIAEELGDPYVMGDALNGRHISLLHVAHIDERLSASEQLMELAQTMRHRERMLQALHARTFDLFQAGDVAEARTYVSELESLAADVRQPLYAHFAVGWSASLAQMEGRFEEAEALATKSFEMRRRMETADAESVFAAQLFMIRLGQGRLGELVPLIERFVQEYPALAAWRAGVPLAYLAADRRDEAVGTLREMASRLEAIPRDFFWLTAVAVLGEASGKLAHRESADLLYEALAPYSERWVQVGYAGSLGPVARILGLLAAARGERDAAVNHLEDALSRSEAAGLRLFETQARAELDELLTPSR